jgi:hypothetical protein
MNQAYYHVSTDIVQLFRVKSIDLLIIDVQEKWLSQVVEMQPFCAKKGFVLPHWDLATCR